VARVSECRALLLGPASAAGSQRALKRSHGGAARHHNRQLEALTATVDVEVDSEICLAAAIG